MFAYPKAASINYLTYIKFDDAAQRAVVVNTYEVINERALRVF